MRTRQKIAGSFHPGAMLEEKLEELSMPIKTFAVRCGKPEPTIHAVLNGTSSVTPEMAILFEKVLGIPAHLWLNMQVRYDESVARSQREEELKASSEWYSHFHFTEMVKKGYITAKEKLTTTEKIERLLAFFGVAKISAWEVYYQRQALGAEFRLSLSGVADPYSLSAWLRHGERKALEEHGIPPFSQEKLREVLPAMSELAHQGKTNFLPELQGLCRQAGVILVFSPSLTNAKANGATRWIRDMPLVQVSDYHKQYDIVWFSLFHELGHILLHGKRDVFLEGVEYGQRNEKKEKEADDFAANCLIPPKTEGRLRTLRYSRKNLEDFCAREHLHAAIAVGRLHHLGLLDYRQGNKFIPQITFSGQK